MIISMYGGGFATIPAYLRDLFGTMQVGAIHGRLITAWSMAAVLGPQLVNYLSTYRSEHGVARAEAYNTPCTSWPACSWSAWSATFSSAPSISGSIIRKLPQLSGRWKRPDLPT